MWAVILCGFCLLSRFAQIALSFWLIGGYGLARWAWLLPMRDILNFSVWLAGGFGRLVQWRGRCLVISQDGW